MSRWDKEDAFKQFFSYCNNCFLENSIDKKNFFVGFSGGADSTLLLLWLKEYAIANPQKITQIIAIHVVDNVFCSNSVPFFEDYKKNVAHVTKFCFQQKIPLFIYDASERPCEWYGRYMRSLEAMWRSIRWFAYHYFSERFTAPFLCIGHNQDDLKESLEIARIRNNKNFLSLNDESFTFNKNTKIIRPLLYLSSKKIREILQRKKILYIIENSNNSDRFLRIQVRRLQLQDKKIFNESFEKGGEGRKNFYNQKGDARLIKIDDYLLRDEDERLSIIKGIVISIVGWRGITGGILREADRFIRKSSKKNHSLGVISMKKNKIVVVFDEIWNY